MVCIQLARRPGEEGGNVIAEGDRGALLAATVDVLTACFGYDVGVRATRDAIVTLDLAA